MIWVDGGEGRTVELDRGDGDGDRDGGGVSKMDEGVWTRIGDEQAWMEGFLAMKGVTVMMVAEENTWLVLPWQALLSQGGSRPSSALGAQLARMMTRDRGA
jgi:hypothetical protein